MSAALDEIRKPVEKAMDEFEVHFSTSMKGDVPLLETITRYILKRKGKQLRPMFVFLSAGMHGGITDTSFRAATLIELLHTATLVHDDVVDDSNQRRGFFSINALWKNKIAVLVGDFLLSKGLLLSVEHSDHNLLKIVSEAVRVMSEGELLQLEKARRLDISEDVYFEIIRRKTASLIASCCACGAASAGASFSETEKMYRIGELIGIAFQIKDDLFDFGPDGIIGKPTGTDIKESKMTLPLIHALADAEYADKRRVIRLIKSRTTDREQIDEVIGFVRRSGGIVSAHQKMMEYRQKALDELADFPYSDYRDSLEKLIRYTTDRSA
ncbi:MAG: polyprenyl synthetase family protein [Bacteroidota bacterium]